MDQLNITFDYDEETDILMISLGTGEPSFSEEVDDILLVDRGYFSGQITGFQVMDVKLHGIKKVQLDAFIAKAIQKEKKLIESYMRQRTGLSSMIHSRMASDPKIRDVLAEA